jgi:GH24 family phage-related lysozyme (muramidase)
MIKLKDILLEAPKTNFSAELIDFNESNISAGQMIFDYIRSHEKFVPFTYDDNAGYPPKPYDKSKGAPKGRLTIGYGTTDPEHAYPGNKITEQEAKRLSVTGINDAADCVRRWQSRTNEFDAHQRKITLSMFRALIDFVYNVGCSAAVNGAMFDSIESGDYEDAYTRLKTGNWGHESRRTETAELFAQEGFPSRHINTANPQFVANFKTKK